MYEEVPSKFTAYFFIALGLAFLVTILIPGGAEWASEAAGDNGCGARNEGSGPCEPRLIYMIFGFAAFICLLGGVLAYFKARRWERENAGTWQHAFMTQGPQVFTQMTAAQSGDPHAQRLAKLEQLRASGAISQDEYDRARAQQTDG